MANKTSTLVTRTLDMGIEDFNQELSRAVRGHVIGSWTAEPRFMVATGDGSVLIECRTIRGPDGTDRLAVGIEFRRCSARQIAEFLRRFDRVMLRGEASGLAALRARLVAEAGRHSLRPKRVRAAA